MTMIVEWSRFGVPASQCRELSEVLKTCFEG